MTALVVGGPRPFRGLFIRWEQIMATRKAIPQHAEPLGIVISNGDRDEPPPLFWSYEWCPPDSVVETKKGVSH
jgi:hypothetical protein